MTYEYSCGKHFKKLFVSVEIANLSVISKRRLVFEKNATLKIKQIY